MSQKFTPDTTPSQGERALLLGGGETILLVEDQKLMQASTTRGLTQLGYRVLVAGSVREGFQTWQKHHNEVALIVTDYSFRGSQTGMDLLLKVQALEPSLPVLIVSGSWLPDARKDPPLPANVAYLSKPYRKEEMASTVHRLLSQRAPMVPSWVIRDSPRS